MRVLARYRFSCSAQLAALLRLEADALFGLLGNPERPRIRADCEGGPRPCPWLGRRYHLGLEVVGRARGPQIVLFDAGAANCPLDLAERSHTLEEIGVVLGVTKERARQLCDQALARFAEHVPAHVLLPLGPEAPGVVWPESLDD